VKGIHLYPKDVARLELSLPARAEQRRIADILDKADGIRRKRKEAIALTEELLRSAFLEMFGDPATNPKGWPVKALGEVLDHLDAGWSANGDSRLRAEDEYGVLKVSAVTSGIFRADEHKAVSASAIDRELVTPRRGDLLFSRANTRELVAATCLVERDEPHLFLPDKLWRVVPRVDAATAPYLRFLLAHDRFRSELTKTATGTSGSMLNVSMEKLRGLRGPFPPIDQQKKFAALAWKSLDAKAKHEAAHEATETLFSALVSCAFSGSLGAPC
jgi:type I restriction enzyme S subunit